MLSGTNSARMPPVCGSIVAASKSAAERRGQGSADDPDTGEFGADATDDILHASPDCFDRCIAVFAEIVDAFEPDQSGDAG